MRGKHAAKRNLDPAGLGVPSSPAWVYLTISALHHAVPMTRTHPDPATRAGTLVVIWNEVRRLVPKFRPLSPAARMWAKRTQHALRQAYKRLPRELQALVRQHAKGW